jgi:hypothetical protein
VVVVMARAVAEGERVEVAGVRAVVADHTVAGIGNRLFSACEASTPWGN